MTVVYLEKMNEKAELPSYANETDAGMDVRAVEDTVLAPGETKLVHTGLKAAIPAGYEIQVRPRSGLSLKTPLRLCNTPGTIDAGYRGEICIIFQNTSVDYEWHGDAIAPLEDTEENHHTLKEKWQKGWAEIHAGDRIAQLVLCKLEKAELKPVESVDSIGTDRGGGFGHTGI